MMEFLFPTFGIDWLTVYMKYVICMTNDTFIADKKQCTFLKGRRKLIWENCLSLQPVKMSTPEFLIIIHIENEKFLNDQKRK